jgi:hypothetical protein
MTHQSGIPWLVEWISKLPLPYLIHFLNHFKRYVGMFHGKAGFDIVRWRRYDGYLSQNDSLDTLDGLDKISPRKQAQAALVSNRDLQIGEELRLCNGRLTPLSEKEEDGLQELGRDFSVLYSSRCDHMCLFLGPARFANHACEPNAAFCTTRIGNEVYLRIIRPVPCGSEITVSYGEHYFGKSNLGCMCEGCERAGLGYFKAESKLLATETFPQGHAGDLKVPNDQADVPAGQRRAKADASFHIQSQSDHDFALKALDKYLNRFCPCPVSFSKLPQRIMCSHCNKGAYTFEVSSLGFIECHKCLRHALIFHSAWPNRSKISSSFYSQLPDQDWSETDHYILPPNYVIQEVEDRLAHYPRRRRRLAVEMEDSEDPSDFEIPTGSKLTGSKQAHGKRKMSKRRKNSWSSSDNENEQHSHFDDDKESKELAKRLELERLAEEKRLNEELRLQNAKQIEQNVIIKELTAFTSNPKGYTDFPIQFDSSINAVASDENKGTLPSDCKFLDYICFAF